MDFLVWILNKYFDLKFWLSRFFEKTVPPAEPVNVAERVLEVFIKHGVEKNQIPRFFNKLTLEDVSTTENLIKKLSPELINEIAELFNVRIEWLEGVDNVIYNFYSCYKQPELFFELLSKINATQTNTPFRILTSVDKFDYQQDYYQPFVMILLEPIGELGEDTIYRYHHDTLWQWGHQPCRIQVKALAYLFQKIDKYGVVPIFHTDFESLEKVSEGLQIPNALVQGCLITNPSLEDYVLAPQQSAVSKESEELPVVMKYIEEYNLKDSCSLVPKVAASTATESINETFHQKGAKARHEPAKYLKQDCILFWLQYKHLSNNETARRFYNSLEGDKKNILAPTNAEKTLSTAISEYKRKEELIAKNKLPNWLKGFNP